MSDIAFKAFLTVLVNMTFHTHSKNRNRIKRDTGRHILNGLNFNIKRRETSRATHPTIFKKGTKKSASDSLRNDFHSMEVDTERERDLQSRFGRKKTHQKV